MNADDKIRHIYFHKGFKLEELEKYGFVKSKGWGYYELWINNKLAISVPVGRRRPKGGKYHLSFESCYDKPTIAMLFVVIKMANDGMFELYEETRESLKRKKIENLENEIKKLKGEK